jgi:predicted DNA-binding protein YlxM (UPF0122 family)
MSNTFYSRYISIVDYLTLSFQLKYERGKYFGITLAEVARNLGVTTSAIFNILKRKNDKFN